MAAVTNINTQVWGFTTVTGPHRMTSSSVQMYGCFLACAFSGTYASADNATIAAVTAIQAARRNGKTPTLRGATLAQVATETVSGTDNVVGAKTVAISSSNITLELTQTDLSTERADGAMGTFKEPLVLYVCFTEA